MKFPVCLVILFFVGTVFSASLNSDDAPKVNEDPTEPINGVSGDEKFLNDKVNEGPTEPVNGVGDEPEDKQMKLLRDEKKGPSSPPVNGARDEERPRFDAASAGQGSVPEMTYDSAEIAVAHDVMNDPNGVWEKYAPETQWCTVDGRSEIYSSTSSPITAAQCQAKCVKQDSHCRAVEFWEAYNYACFKCTDTTKITAYTNTDDLAYPVYVWVKWAPWRWFKNSQNTQWCTASGRSLISSDTDKPITARDCQRRCEVRRPGCQAVEFWETYNYACFQCTDLSLITSYTNTDDLAYPVYVWIRD